ncbi:MAG: CsbD family protein [Oligoflexales bacterium]|nr:CsbD family protein [Oligoflexales bacterium]
MNADIVQGEWNIIKGKIKSKWAKLKDDEIECFRGNLEQLTGKLQKAYGYEKEKAEKEYSEFKKSLSIKEEEFCKKIKLI